jgi:type IV pilus assembly protein PilV
MSRPPSPHPPQRGGSLIEVMVAALLLAIGLLSMGAMQASAFQLSKDAEFRATASEIAQTLGEMVKSNAGGAASYTNDLEAFVSPAPQVDVLTNCTGAAQQACTNAAIAAEDMSRVRALARNRLPDGQVLAQFVNDAGNGQSAIDLWIAWLPADVRSGEANVDAQMTNGCPDGFDAANVGVRCHYFRIAP